ncbi:MAG TPA: hypothetical protein VII95_20485 [Terriglobales bacterium]|jgi:hypothetical protein
MATSVDLPERIRCTEMSDNQLRAMIEREAKALGLTAEEAVSRVRKGDIGANYLWLDLASLVRLLYG